MLAPIVIFAFNRPDALLRLKNSLESNNLYATSEKYVFVDGCRNDSDEPKVSEVIEIAHTITDNVNVSPVNKGLATSVISGISEMFKLYEKVIVLEDDLVCTPNFLDYMNQMLEHYRQDARIISICGYGLKIKKPRGYIGDIYLSCRSSSWGWGTWKNRWDNIDWQISDWQEFSHDNRLKAEFNLGGSDMFSMLQGYMTGKNNSWAIRFCYNQFKQHKFSICPFQSKVDNIGFGKDATNCDQKFSRFKTDMDINGSNRFIVPEKLEYNQCIARQLKLYHSIPMRIYSKVRKTLNL